MSDVSSGAVPGDRPSVLLSQKPEESMRKEIAWLLVAVAFVGGFFVGRRFPAHTYAPAPAGLVLDTTTGKVCSPIGERKVPSKAATGVDGPDIIIPECGKH